MGSWQIGMILIAVLLIIVALYVVPKVMRDQSWRDKGFRRRPQPEDDPQPIETTIAPIPQPQVVTEPVLTESAAPVLASTPAIETERPEPQAVQAPKSEVPITAVLRPPKRDEPATKETPTDITTLKPPVPEPDTSPLVAKPAGGLLKGMGSLKRAADARAEDRNDRMDDGSKAREPVTATVIPLRKSAGPLPITINDNDDEEDDMAPGAFGNIGSRVGNAVGNLVRNGKLRAAEEPSPLRDEMEVTHDEQEARMSERIQREHVERPRVVEEEEDDDQDAIVEILKGATKTSVTDLPLPIRRDPRRDVSEEEVRVRTAGPAAEARMAIVEDDDEDELPTDFSGMGTFDAAERAEMLREMDDEATNPQLRIMEDERKRAKEAEAAKNGDGKTFAWTAFIGDDATALSVEERRELIDHLKMMHEPSCGDTLFEAFQEEEPTGLRPRVLRAIAESYNEEYMRPLYEFCIAEGTEEEKEVAHEALAALDAGR